MSSADYLRRQADACLRIARSCFDLTSAERMRLLAAELRAKAAEVEAQDAVPNHIYDRENWTKGGSSRRR
jgi:hypothetical protein